ncbi:hypothetical protein ACFXCT_23145, partial [Streptomyces sp. NPDC059425]
MVSRTMLAHRLFTGISRQYLACPVEKSAAPLPAGAEGRRHAARGGVRKRAVGAGARHQLVFVDRLVAPVTHLRGLLPGRRLSRRLPAEGGPAQSRYDPHRRRGLAQGPDHLEVISFGESAVADQGAGDAGEGEEVVGFAFV